MLNKFLFVMLLTTSLFSSQTENKCCVCSGKSYVTVMINNQEHAYCSSHIPEIVYVRRIKKEDIKNLFKN